MNPDPNDPNIIWMTEEEMCDLGQPSKLGLWMILLAGPLGAIAAQFLWWWLA